MRIRVIFTAFIFLFVSGMLPAQEAKMHCGTDEHYLEQLKAHPEMRQVREQLEQFTEQYIKKHANQRVSGANYIIPVVFHVLHNYGPENISDAQIIDQVRIWNLDFQKKSPDTTEIVPVFQSIAADCEVEFRLATIDPDGNCTNGIDRIVTLKTYDADDNSKLNPWPNVNYFNVWTVASFPGAGLIAYAQFPGGPAKTDGVISLSNYIGSIGTGNLEAARVMSHETGHCFNLFHIWGNTEVGTICGDDGVGDTPKTKGTFSCNLNKSDCNPPALENVQNYMDYANCRRMFTNGQKMRMQGCLNSTVGNRNLLWSNTSLAISGTADPYVVPLCAPVCDFHSSKQLICVGASVQFIDDSWKGHPSGWSWSFPGGTPSTSTDSAPMVQYNLPGKYDVSLMVANSSGADSVVKTTYIMVADTGASSLPAQEDFENATFPPANAFVLTATGANAWQHVTNVGALGSTSSIKVDNYNSNPPGAITEYVTPQYDFSKITSAPSLNFYLAYALRNNDTTRADMLKIYYSTNCGQSWVMRYSKSGSRLVTTAARKASNFIPTAADWQEDSVSVGSILSGKPAVSFKFQAVSANGNNIYIDNINVSGVVGVEEAGGLNPSFEIYPNPSKNNPVVEIVLPKTEEVKMDLFDLTGRKITTIVNQKMSVGVHRFSIRQELSQGVYLVTLKTRNITTSMRLIILD